MKPCLRASVANGHAVICACRRLSHLLVTSCIANGIKQGICASNDAVLVRVKPLMAYFTMNYLKRAAGYLAKCTGAEAARYWSLI